MIEFFVIDNTEKPNKTKIEEAKIEESYYQIEDKFECLWLYLVIVYSELEVLASRKLVTTPGTVHTSFVLPKSKPEEEACCDGCV